MNKKYGIGLSKGALSLIQVEQLRGQKQLEHYKLGYPPVEKLFCHDGKLGGEIFRRKILWFMKCKYALHITPKSIQLIREEYSVNTPDEGKIIVPKRVIELYQAGWLVGAEAEGFFAKYEERATYRDGLTGVMVTIDYYFTSKKTVDGIVYRLRAVRS